jgi:Sulfotransferase domain
MLLLKKWLFNCLPSWLRKCPTPILYQSNLQNVYHCSVQKSASQWVRGILSDERTYRYCGLTPYNQEIELYGGYDPRKIVERYYDKAFPKSTIATPLYIHYEGFAAIPKPARYKAFFVMRDPRDIVISWYFSIKCSHPVVGEVEQLRLHLNRLSDSDGLLYAIEFLHDYGLFKAQRSWAHVPTYDPNVLLVRYEDLLGPNNQPIVERLLEHCDIRMPSTVLAELLAAHSFEQLSGRKRGQEDRHAHYRKGIAGDWRNYFDLKIEARFQEVAGDVLAVWNY